MTDLDYAKPSDLQKKAEEAHKIFEGLGPKVELVSCGFFICFFFCCSVPVLPVAVILLWSTDVSLCLWIEEMCV